MSKQRANIYRLGTTASVAYTSAAGSTTAFGSGIFAARLWSTTSCFVEVSKADSATSTAGVPLAAQTEMTVVAYPGEKASAVQAGGGGTLYVTALT